MAMALFDNSTDPDAYRKRLAAMLAQGATDASPVQSWTQGAARLAQALIAGNMIGELRAEQDQKNKDYRAAIGNLPGLGQPAASPSPSTSPASQPDYGKAIASIESGGRYDALGPVTKTGDRAYGKYQVMGSNVPAWTKAHLGTEMTPEQFAASPQAQDAVFKGQFGQYAQKYGPEGASRAWFAGEGNMNNMGAKDQLGTTVAQYGQKFAQAAGMPSSGTASAPQGGAMRQQVEIPPQVAAQIRQYMGSPDQRLQALGMQLYQQYAKPAEYDYKDVNGRLLRVSKTGGPVADVTPQLPGYRPMTPQEKQAGGIDANYPAFVGADGKPIFGQPSMNVSLSADKEGSELMAKRGIDAFDTAQKAAADASRRTAGYGQMLTAMQGFTPGATADLQLRGKAVLKDLGIIGDVGVSDAEAFKAVQRRLELASTPKGQGQITENERVLIRDTLPSITNSPEGIVKTIDMLRRLDEYEVKVAQLWRESARANRNGVPSYLDVSDKIAALGPPLTDEELVSLNSLKAGQGQQGPAASGQPQTAPPTMTRQQIEEELRRRGVKVP